MFLLQKAFYKHYPSVGKRQLVIVLLVFLPLFQARCYQFIDRSQRGETLSADSKSIAVVGFPASVAFGLSLLHADTGAVVWRGSYSKTQASLSENLLDFSTSIQSKGKWLTVQELARLGLESLIRQW